MYKILVEYVTGDSFNTYEESEFIRSASPNWGEELEWSSLEIAKVNLLRIKLHYEWVESYGKYSDERKEAPAWIVKKSKPIINKLKDYGDYIDSQYQDYINLLDDNGKTVEAVVSWIGHFETLRGARVVPRKEDGWSFSLD